MAKTPPATLRGGGACVRGRSAASCLPVASEAPIAAFSTVVFSRPGRLELGSGAAVLAQSGAEIEILPETPGLGAGAALTGTVRLVRGRAEVMAHERAALIWGGQNAALVSPGASAAMHASKASFGVATFEGDVRLVVGSSQFAVAPGSRRVVTRSHSNPERKALLAAPQFVSEPGVAIAMTGAVSLPVSWEPVAGTAFYEVRLRGDGGLVEATTAEATWSFASVRPGSYQVEARAVGADGLPSAWSTQAARVVGVTLPAKARVQNDTIEMPFRAHVGLSFTEGLEARYAGSASAVSAPVNLPLAGGNAQTLFLRLPGGSKEASVRVVPRSVLAKIEMSPANPNWPHDPIQISVRIVDNRGLDALDEEGTSVNVRLGLSTLDVVWKREDGALTAVIPPRSLSSPQVLRVEATDRKGKEIGFDHREIGVARR